MKDSAPWSYLVSYLCDESEANVIRSRIVHHKNTRISVTKISPLLVLREGIDFCPPNQANPTRNVCRPKRVAA